MAKQQKISTPNQLEVYQTLYVLESELDEIVFGELIQLFFYHWEHMEPTFIKYFQKHYCNRTGMRLTLFLKIIPLMIYL